jgi:hypothetical protein
MRVDTRRSVGLESYRLGQNLVYLLVGADLFQLLLK